MKAYNPISRAEKLRKRIIKPETKQVLFTSFAGALQEKDIALHTKIADDFFRAKIYTKDHEKELDPFRGEPAGIAAERLGIGPEECNAVFLAQINGCNLDCWQCYVDKINKSGNPKYGRYFTAEEYLLNFLIWSKRTQNSVDPNEKLNVLRLSGGEVFIVPEIIFWTIEAVEHYNLQDSIYIWVDCNLATGDFYWRYLSPEQREKISNYRNIGFCVCYKGCDKENFFEITGADPEFFDLQFGIHSLLLEEGLDVYSYYYPLVGSFRGLRKRLSSFMDILVEKVDYLAPLRLSTPETKIYGPTKENLTLKRKIALENQWEGMRIWKQELLERFGIKECSLKPHQVPPKN